MAGQEAGFGPAEATKIMTLNGPKILGVAKDVGSVEVGKYADLVVLNGNPAANILSTRNISMLIIRGRVIRPDSLRATWK